MKQYFEENVDKIKDGAKKGGAILASALAVAYLYKRSQKNKEEKKEERKIIEVNLDKEDDF